MLYRVSAAADIPSLARIRAREWGGVEYWEARISGYLAGALNPQHALGPRSCYVAVDPDAVDPDAVDHDAAGQEFVVGFVAGHLSRRYACDGEIEWINVVPEQRGKSVASGLLRLLAAWFAGQAAYRICVDVQPSNATARAFYRRHGAVDLNPHWLVWNDVRTILDQPRRSVSA